MRLLLLFQVKEGTRCDCPDGALLGLFGHRLAGAPLPLGRRHARDERELPRLYLGCLIVSANFVGGLGGNILVCPFAGSCELNIAPKCALMSEPVPSCTRQTKPASCLIQHPKGLRDPST